MNIGALVSLRIMVLSGNNKCWSVKKREPSYTMGGNVNWFSHYGEQYGGSLKKSYHMIWQSHSWAYI